MRAVCVCFFVCLCVEGEDEELVLGSCRNASTLMVDHQRSVNVLHRSIHKTTSRSSKQQTGIEGGLEAEPRGRDPDATLAQINVHLRTERNEKEDHDRMTFTRWVARKLGFEQRLISLRTRKKDHIFSCQVNRPSLLPFCIEFCVWSFLAMSLR